MKPSVCFVAPKAYAMLSGAPDVAHVGGAEVQQVLVARGLARRGYPVRFVTLDHGQADGQAIDGIDVFTSTRTDAGLPGIRVVHPKWTGLWRALRRADADIYLQRTCGIESGQVCWWCRRHGRRFVFCTGSDADCDAALGSLPSLLERVLYRYALKRADAIVVQTRTQQRLLAASFSRPATVVRSCRPMPATGAARPEGPPRVLWVGRFSPVKRPQWCLDLAQRRPDLPFDIVGASNHESAHAEAICRRAETLPNVTLHGYVPYGRMGTFYEAASILLSTSHYEGFSNTYLEAWSHGRPVVGTTDPDDVVKTYGLGHVASDLEGLAAGLDKLLSDQEAWTQAARRARQYVAEHHSVEAAVTGYETVLAQVMGGSGARE